MKVRNATGKDIEAISRIVAILDSKDTKYSGKNRIENEVANREYFVAGRDDTGEIVGAMRLIRHQKKSVELYTIAANPIRIGTGTALIEYAVCLARKQSIPVLWCWSASRFNAKGFYEKNGFRGKLYENGTSINLSRNHTLCFLEDQYKFIRKLE